VTFTATCRQLEAVLADVAREGVETIVVGGDVAAGALPRETIEQLMALGDRVRFVRGNADREIVAAYDQGRHDVEAEPDPPQRAAAFCAARISRHQRDFLADFAPRVVLDIDGLGPTLFCHGSPRSDTEIITTATSNERLRDILDGVEQPVVIGGHTHRQFDRRVDGWRVINAGSVGVPYEGRPGPTGRCSAPKSSCAAPTTTSTRQSRRCDRAATPTSTSCSARACLSPPTQTRWLSSSNARRPAEPSALGHSTAGETVCGEAERQRSRAAGAHSRAW